MVATGAVVVAAGVVVVFVFAGGVLFFFIRLEQALELAEVVAECLCQFGLDRKSVV